MTPRCPICQGFMSANSVCKRCGGSEAYRAAKHCLDCNATISRGAILCMHCAKVKNNDLSLKKPIRMKGEKEQRCLWCGRFRCDDPLRLCDECQAWYDVRKAELVGVE